MRFLIIQVMLCILIGTCVLPVSSVNAQGGPAGAYVPLAPADLQSLVAPIALYPDAMLAQILVACTYPDDVIAAAQYLDNRGDPNAIDDQGWDVSVAGVARYPDLLHYMAANPDWMNSLGAAFLNQQADVMSAVQVLRSDAMAAGNLVSNDQQHVIVDGGTIEIIPTNPDDIYPPIYDPNLVYQPEVLAPGSVYVPLIHYWNAIPVGVWLHDDLDWHDHRIYVGSWGANRPWWHHGGGGFDYTHDRPGLYTTNQNIAMHVHNQVVNVKGGAWSRQNYDSQKPMPHEVARPGGRAPAPRLGTGHEANERPGTGAISNYNHAPTVAQESERGRESVERGGIRAPAPAEHRSEPENAPARRAVPAPSVRSNPQPAARAEPERQAPQRSAPADRGGAVGSYDNGAAASHESNRGAASRGSSGGGRR